MRKIINKRMYDTEKSQKIYEWWSVHDASDFRQVREILYQTDPPNSNWFLFGAGGPLSKYALDTGNGSTYGEDIVELREHEAYEWLEEKQAIEVIEKYFPDMVEPA